MRKTALMTGVAGLFLMAAPAFAQDATSPQTPPASAEVEAEAAVEAETQAPTLSLTPGAIVQGPDGQLGVLVGARLHAGAQQLTVKGEDGVIRAVPIDGIRQEGEAVVVDFTLGQYAEAEVITEADAPALPEVPDADAVLPDDAEVDATLEAEVEAEAETVVPPAPTPPTLPTEATGVVPPTGAPATPGLLPGKPN